jgi:hypothetical protein
VLAKVLEREMHPPGYMDTDKVAKAEKAPAGEQRGPAPAAKVRPAGPEAKGLEARNSRSPAELRGDDIAPGGLDQIREILFGALHREFERRLVRVDAQLAARAQELEHEIRRRTEMLEAHARKESEALALRFEREFNEMNEKLRRAARESRDALSALEQRLAKLEETTTQDQRELRQLLLEQAKSFFDESQRLRRELLGMLQEELGFAGGEPVEASGDAAEKH